MNRERLLMLVEIAIFAAIGIILDMLSFSLPQGGSVSFVMVPIVLMAMRWGIGAGLVTGLLIGVLQMVLGPKIYHWAQALLDYGFAFTAVGLAAVVRQPLLTALAGMNKVKIAIYVSIGAIIGGLLRYFVHTLSGVVFFSEYAGDQNVWVYSIVYNGSYMLPAIILTAVVCAFLFTASPKLLKR
ncbi:energy-coupled thiamine transporter ThiT [Solibacillus sp. CAU 1738]|uniref:energy-coupled thiamine transporter ThiT n=1 Tax=Solibacillus sp. CAU 1738 TaxID=3140363 RepID=UPI003260B886